MLLGPNPGKIRGKLDLVETRAGGCLFNRTTGGNSSVPGLIPLRENMSEKALTYHLCSKEKSLKFQAFIIGL